MLVSVVDADRPWGLIMIKKRRWHGRHMGLEWHSALGHQSRSTELRGRSRRGEGFAVDWKPRSSSKVETIEVNPAALDQ
jgi:hypothetical protein